MKHPIFGKTFRCEGHKTGMWLHAEVFALPWVLDDFLEGSAEVRGGGRELLLCFLSVMLSQVHCGPTQVRFHCLTSPAVLGCGVHFNWKHLNWI